MADSISAIEPNRAMMVLSKLLSKGKAGMNAAGRLPVIGGAGDILIGDAPEALADYAHGFGPLRGRGMTTRVDPRLADIAGLPFLGAIPRKAARVATKIPEQSKLASRIVDPELSRRVLSKQREDLIGRMEERELWPHMLPTPEPPRSAEAADLLSELYASNQRRYDMKYGRSE